MAEIEIKKKKPVWPWIILALIILAILYFLFFDGNEEINTLNENNIEQIEEPNNDLMNNSEDEFMEDTNNGINSDSI